MIVIIISANSEWRSVLEILDPAAILKGPFGEYFYSQLSGYSLIFAHGGWGKTSAAASTQYLIEHFHPEVLVNLGTCGGLKGQIEVGEIILACETIFYDIFERMGDPDEAVQFYSTQLDLTFLRQPYPQKVRVMRLASADQDIDPEMVTVLRDKFEVAAADWESSAIAWVAARNQTRCLILRGVSDIVGSDGGEIYNDTTVQFHSRAGMIMRSLIEALPGWLAQIS